MLRNIRPNLFGTVFWCNWIPVIHCWSLQTRYLDKSLRKAFSIHYTKSTGAAIEPIIGHLKLDYRMARNYLKSAIGDRINQQSIFTATSAVTGHGIGCTRHRYPFHLIWTDCYCAPDSSGRFGIYDFRYCCSSKSGRQIRNWSADSCTRSI